MLEPLPTTDASVKLSKPRPHEMESSSKLRIGGVRKPKMDKNGHIGVTHAHIASRTIFVLIMQTGGLSGPEATREYLITRHDCTRVKNYYVLDVLMVRSLLFFLPRFGPPS